MKKFIISAFALILSVSSFAQKQGETTFEGTLGLSIVPSTSNYYVDGSLIQRGKQSFTFGMDVELGAGYFFANNWKAAGTLGFNLVNNSSTMFTINPYIAYYLPVIADFYYVPAFKMNFGFGNKITNLNESELATLKYSAFDFVAALNLLSFEYRVTSHLGLGISAGQIGYAHNNLKTENVKISTNTFIFDINTAKVSVIYYL